jgi:hypothetical protein
MMAGDCKCLDGGPICAPGDKARHLGVDTTAGRFADVTLRRCAGCGRLWLRYQVEYEAFTASGRWAEAPIDAASAAAMTPAAAAGFLERAPFHRYGGSYWGHGGKRGRGWLPW